MITTHQQMNYINLYLNSLTKLFKIYKMSSNISEALLKQKIEFLEIELDEFKKKEDSYRRTNDSLLQALGTSDTPSLTVTPMQAQTIQELKKTNEQQEKELFELKSRYKDRISTLEKEKQQLILLNKDLEYSLKQQRLSMESEKLEIISQLQKLESDKLSVEHALKSYEQDRSHSQELFKYQQELKIAELQHQLEFHKEESRTELLRSRKDTDKAVIELKSMYETEIDLLKNQSMQLQDKIRHQSSKIGNLKEESNPKMMMIRIEELEGELEYYKNNRNNSYRKKEEESVLISSREDLSEIKKWDSKVKKQGGNSAEYEIENLLLQNERVKVQLDRARLEVDQFANELERNRREQAENECLLKNEIKFLIGKLLKAKSKLSIEGELCETVRRESMLSTLRIRSLNKSRSNSRNSPNKEYEQYY